MPLQHSGLTLDSDLLSFIGSGLSYSCNQASGKSCSSMAETNQQHLFIILADQFCVPVTPEIERHHQHSAKEYLSKVCGLIPLFPRPLYLSIVEASQFWVKLKLPKHAFTLKELTLLLSGEIDFVTPVLKVQYLEMVYFCIVIAVVSLLMNFIVAVPPGRK